MESSISGVISVATPIITAIIGSIATVVVTKYKRRSVNPSTKVEEDMMPTHSTRIDTSYKVPDDMKGATCYKTRRFDRVRAPYSGSILVKGDVITLTGKNFIMKAKGVTSIASNGINVRATEDIALVTQIDAGEGRVLVLFTENKNNSAQEEQ